MAWPRAMQANHLDAKIDLCGCVDLVLEIGDVLTSRPAAPLLLIATWMGSGRSSKAPRR